LGAEVIKVESMAMPDSARGLGTSPARGMGGMFVGTGRSKQSVMLNLKTKAGVDTFLGEFSPKKTRFARLQISPRSSGNEGALTGARASFQSWPSIATSCCKTSAPVPSIAWESTTSPSGRSIQTSYTSRAQVSK
jgi:hypothetical protein